MGTNFYARIIPTKDRKEKIKLLIDSNNFNEIRTEISRTYGSFTPFNISDVAEGEIHLGKRSSGWRFLWNPNIYQIRNGHSEKIEIEPGVTRYKFIPEPDIPYYLYPLTKEGIKAFIDLDYIEIYDEYNEKQNKEEFWNMALNWGCTKDNEGWDGESYEKWEMEQNPKYIPHEYNNEYTKFIENCGFKLCKYKTDFYSDGLRFATSTEFC